MGSWEGDSLGYVYVYDNLFWPPRAVSEGLCGVPSYQVNNRGPVLWGQDKQSTVEDLICGWTDITTAAKL